MTSRKPTVLLMRPGIGRNLSTEDLLLLATATVKSVKRCHTITELVVVWSVCSVCTNVTKSKVVGPHIQLDTLQRFTLFALAVARGSKTSHRPGFK